MLNEWCLHRIDRLQALLAHDLVHTALEAYWHVTGAANICLSVCVLGAKATPIRVNSTAEHWTVHSSRWSFLIFLILSFLSSYLPTSSQGRSTCPLHLCPSDRVPRPL